MSNIDKIICIGKNYLEHVAEFGDVIPAKPIIFLKPGSILKQIKSWNETTKIELPQTDETTDYECEIVLRIKENGYMLSHEQAEKIIDAITIGFDMTLRSLQAVQKERRYPWCTSKVFINSAIVGPWIKIQDFPNYFDTEFSFKLNDELKQKAFPHEMYFKPAELIAYASHCFPLCAGDIFFTGTPAGVGPVKSGDVGKVNWSKYNYAVVWK